MTEFAAVLAFPVPLFPVILLKSFPFLPFRLVVIPHSTLARMYDRSLISVARGVGRGFSPGLDTAVDEAGDV